MATTVVVMFLSERGICFRELPEPLPRTWHIPVARAVPAGTVRAEPEWQLHEYVRVDAFTYVDREPKLSRS